MTLAKAWDDRSATKASISSTVGGKPSRSKVARRIKVRRSAGRAGFKPWLRKAASIKASISLCAPPVFFEASGIGGGVNGWKAQISSGLYSQRGLEAGCAEVLQTAPCSIQRRRISISAGASLFRSLGGI